MTSVPFVGELIPHVVPNPAAREADELRFLRLRNVLVASAAALAVGGCTAEASFVAPPYTSPAAPAIADGLTTESFSSILLASQPNTAKARQMIPGLSRDNPQIAEEMNRAIDAVISAGLLNDQQTGTNKLQPDVILPSITSIPMQQETANALYVIQAGRVVSKASGYVQNISADQAHGELQAIPNGPENLRSNAQQAVDVAYAEKVIRAYSGGSTDKETETRQALQDIKNPTVEAQAARVVDSIDGSKILNDLWIGQKTEAQALEDAANITDPIVKQKVLAGIQAYRHDSYAAAEAKYVVDDVNTAYEKELAGFGGAFKKDQSAAVNFIIQVGEDKQEALFAVEVGVGQRIAAAHGLKPQKLESLLDLPNPREVVDLSNLVGFQKIDNNCLRIATEDKCSSKEPTFNQFGEIFVKDGVLTLTFQHGGGLTEKIRSQMQTAINVNKPFLEAAFASGQLVSVRLTVGAIPNPAFVGGTRELYLNLPQDDRMSMDQLASYVGHETMHALTRNFFAGINVSEAQKRRLNAACNALVMTAYDDFEFKLNNQPELLANLRAAAKPEHQPIIDTLTKAVEQHKLEQVAGLNQKELDDAFLGMQYNECEKVPVASIRIIENAVAEAGVVVKTDDLKYLFETQAFKNFGVEWIKLIAYTSVYERVINESSYVDTPDPDKSGFGHSEDAAIEVCGSLSNVALRHPEEFTPELRAADKAERAAVIDFLGLCSDEIEVHPSLKDYVQRMRTHYEAMR